MENHGNVRCHGDSSVCSPKSHDASTAPHSDNVVCHENKRVDFDHEDVDVTDDWVKHTSAVSIETQAVQCTDDQHLTKEHCLSETSDVCQVEQVLEEDIDLPHWDCDSTERNSSDIKAPRLMCCLGNSSETVIDEKALSLNCIREHCTSKKLPAPVDHDQEDSSPLDIHNYLKQPRHQSCVQNLQVFMLHSATHNHVPEPNISNKSPPSQPQNIYREEMTRLATYREYPADLPVFAITLAGDGFIFRPEKQIIECSFCSLQINLSELTTRDVNPVKIHWNKSPQCPLKQGRDCGNIPVKKFDETSVEATVPSSSSDNGSSERGRPNVADSERSQPSTASLSVVQPSPVIHYQPTLDPTMTDSAPLVQQEPAPAPSAVQRNSVTRPPESTTGPQSGPGNQGPRNGVGRHDTSTPAPTSSHNGAAAPAANSSKNSKSNKKSKSAKKSVAASSSNGSHDSAQPSSSKDVSTGDKTESKEKKKLTYADLGIFADKPKRADMGVLQKRLSTFEGKWKDSFVKTPQMLAECGMYYAGYADCARCFFCGGGLKNWEAPDEPWIEHARWFPKCAYLRLCKGPLFVDIVQRKNKEGEKIYLKDVEDEMAVKSESDNTNKIVTRQPVTVSTGQSGDSPPASIIDLRVLEEENEELTSQVTCKICMDEKSSVVFLPCGHMVACTNCAIILKNCPLCRAEIKGSVKAHMD